MKTTSTSCPLCGARFSEDDSRRAVTSIRNLRRQPAANVGQDGILRRVGYPPVHVSNRIRSRLTKPAQDAILPHMPSIAGVSQVAYFAQLSNGFLESVQRRTSVRCPRTRTT